MFRATVSQCQVFNFQALSGTNAGDLKQVMVRALVCVMGNSARPLKNTLNMLIVKQLPAQSFSI